MATNNSTGMGSEAPKKFHGRLKIDATFCPTDIDDVFDTVELGSSLRRHQG